MTEIQIDEHGEVVGREKRDAQGRTEHEARVAKGLVPKITATREIRYAKSRVTGEPYPVPKVRVEVIDPTNPDRKIVSEFGGKVAARATHVLMVHSRAAQEGDSGWYTTQRADTWGWWCKGTLATCQKGLADVAKASNIDQHQIVAITEAEA